MRPEEAKEAIAKANAPTTTPSNDLSANFTNHRRSCPKCSTATGSKSLCSAGLSMFEHLNGRPPKNLIR